MFAFIYVNFYPICLPNHKSRRLRRKRRRKGKRVKAKQRKREIKRGVKAKRRVKRRRRVTVMNLLIYLGFKILTR